MKPADRLISSCKHCRFYRLEGRRGGQCQQLGTPVQGSWKACCLALHPFSTSWEDLETLMTLPLPLEPDTAIASLLTATELPIS